MVANLKLVAGFNETLAMPVSKSTSTSISISISTIHRDRILLLSPFRYNLKDQSDKHEPLLGWALGAGVLLAHCLIFLALKSVTTNVDVMPPEKPMMVSLIAPPSILPIVEPKPEPKNEIVPVITKLKPVPVVNKVRPNVDNTPIPLPIVEQFVDSLEPEVTLLIRQDMPMATVGETEKPKPAPVVEDKVEPPKFGVSYLHNPDPSYPKLSRRMHEQGYVLLKVLVSATGDAETVKLEKSSGYELLDQAALDAVKQWRFIPAKRNNQAFSTYVLVPIKFSLAN